MSDSPVCRACGRNRLVVILSLGRMPLANALLTAEQLEQPEPRFPLDLAFCPDCTLVQITETVSQELLFREYLYFSSYSDTMLRHAGELTAELMKDRRLDGNSLVVELASNDGYLLQYYHRAGVPVLGIEPARNVARVAQEERGIRTLCEFFGLELAERLAEQGEKADVIHAHNVLAHVADLTGFVAGIRVLLKDRGVAVIEVPYVKDLIDRVEFDTIYHEHLCYFSLTALDRLFRLHGLQVQQVERVPIHGGSLRVRVGVQDAGGGARSSPSPEVEELLAREREWGMDRVSYYERFGERIERLRRDLVALLDGLKAQGKQIVAYGASAKGSTLLNYFGITRTTIDFVAERNPAKQGRYTPGTQLPICGPERILRDQPDYVLLLTWNLADEILSQQAEYRKRGGRFIIPLPQPRVV